MSSQRRLEQKTATVALGLRSTPQSLGVIGAALGCFRQHCVELRVIREETAGPEGVRGLIGGEFQFAEFGAVPVVQAALEGHAPLILMAAEQVSALYILARSGVATPAGLVGGRLGVLSIGGQTGHSAAQMLGRWNVRDRVELVPLKTYPAIYAALASAKIDAGVLTADYKIAGEQAHGFVQIADLGHEFLFQGPVLATTRRLRDSDPDLCERVVAGYMAAIRAFKSRPDDAIPVLQQHLKFPDAAQTRAIWDFYARRFQDVPLASTAGILRAIESLKDQFPNGRPVLADTIYDPSFVRAVASDKLERL